MASTYLLSQLVDDAAQHHPSHCAYVCRDEQLRYEALAESAMRLACVLGDLGIRRGDRVGLLVGRDLRVPVAVYGALKAGAAFVPIDPQTPSHRIGALLRDCGIEVLVCGERQRESLRKALPELRCLRAVVGLDERADLSQEVVSWDQVDAAAPRPPDVALTEQDLAYIMYTSGSTGRPKGLMHTHASGLAYARLSAELYELTPNDRVGGHAPLHTDMSTFAYLTAPSRAATTVIVPEEHTVFPIELSGLIEREQVTIWYSVPAVLIALIERGALERHDHSQLRWVLFGGEPLSVRQLQTLMQHWPKTRFANVYGPAEVNQCTHYELTPENLSSETRVPLGHIWSNARGLILDPEDREVADGDAGELLIQAPTMMHGYWNRPDLNEAAFFRREAQPCFVERYYRTGDLVRRRSDGLLEFIGRKDRQVKLRGYRVELDEIEAVLTSHSAIREAAVLVHEEKPGAMEIRAAVLLHDDARLNADAVIEFLRDRLPRYAVPSTVFALPDLPRTGAGKIDRKALLPLLGL